MGALEPEAQISANQRGVSFVLTGKNGAVECVIARAALEAFFWLSTDADEAKMLKTFHDGATVSTLSRIESCSLIKERDCTPTFLIR